MNFNLAFLTFAVAAFSLAGAWCDARTKRLPNALTVPACLIAFAFHIASGAYSGSWLGAAEGLGFAAGGFAVGFSILFLLWIAGGGGGGDVKMMAALGAWLGAKLTLYVFLLSTALVAIFAAAFFSIQVVRLGASRAQRSFLSGKSPRRTARHAAARPSRRLMPFGVPLALATWTVVALGVWRGWIQ